MTRAISKWLSGLPSGWWLALAPLGLVLWAVVIRHLGPLLVAFWGAL